MNTNIHWGNSGLNVLVLAVLLLSTLWLMLPSFMKGNNQVALTLHIYTLDTADGSHASIPGVQVAVYDDTNKRFFNGITDKNGYVSIMGIPGRWRFNLEKSRPCATGKICLDAITRTWEEEITKSGSRERALIPQCSIAPGIGKAEAVNHALENNFTIESAARIVAIAAAESGRNLYACLYNPGTDSWDQGILQINTYWNPQVTDDCAFQAFCSFTAAYEISKKGTDFSPWLAEPTDQQLKDARQAVFNALSPQYEVTPRQLKVGGNVTLEFSFINKSKKSWTFYPAVSLRNPNEAIVDLPLKEITLSNGERGNVSWTYTIDMVGYWDVIFGMWLDKDKKDFLGHTGLLNDYIGSVEQLPDNTVNAGLVLDRSGSMSATNKLPLAKSAAKLFVDLSRAGDQLTVSGFSSTGYLVSPLTTIPSADPADPVKQTIKNSIDALTAGGMTNFGAGLQIALDQLKSTTILQTTCGVLMSNGMHNTGSYTSQVQEFQAFGWPIYTVSFGTTVNKASLQQIASDTGGLFFDAEEIGFLLPLFARIQADCRGNSFISFLLGLISQGQILVQDLPPLDPITTLVKFLLSWGGSDLDLVLIKPDGTEIGPAEAAADPNITYVATPTYEFYTVKNPDPGQWRMKIIGADVPSPDPEKFITAAIVEDPSPVSANFLGFESRYNVGDLVDIGVILREGGNPMTGASVTATVTKPDGTSETLTLFDDGAHNDNAADDGIYGNTFTDTDLEGLYTIEATASGSFTRELKHQIQVGDITVAQADLSVTKTDDPDPVVKEQNLTYTLTIVNNGPDNASGVTLTDTLPPGVTFISSTPQGVCTEAGGTVTCNLDLLANGAEAIVTITVAVDPNAPDTLSNTATVAGNETDPDGSNNTAVSTTVILRNGDINADGSIDATDVRWLVEAIMGLRELTAEQRERADVAPPPGLDSTDARYIVEFIQGIRSTLTAKAASAEAQAGSSIGKIQRAEIEIESKQNIVPGEAATLQLSISNLSGSGLADMQIGPQGVIKFDPKVIQARSVKGIGPFQVMQPLLIDNEKGEIRFIAVASRKKFIKEGPIIELEVIAIGREGASSPIEITGFDALRDGEIHDIVATILNGRVTLGRAQKLQVNSVLNIPNPVTGRAVEFRVEGAGIKTVQVEIYDLSGRRVFESGFALGNSLEWHVQNDAGESLANGVYLYIVTIRGFNGEIVRTKVKKLVILR